MIRYLLLWIVCAICLTFTQEHTHLDWHRLSSVTVAELPAYLEALEDTLDRSPVHARRYLSMLEPVVSLYPQSAAYRQFLFLKGQYYYTLGDYSRALSIYLDCARLAGEGDHTQDYLRALSNVATVYARMQRYDESNQQYWQLIPLARQLPDSRRLLIIYVNMANNFISLGQLDSAAEYYQRALPLTRSGSFYRAAVEINLARLNVKLGNYEQARRLARRSAAYADSVQNVEMYLESLANMVNSYKREKRWSAALRLALRAESLAQRHRLRLQLKDVYLNLAEIHQAMTNYPRAVKYFRRYDALKDSLYNESLARQMNELRVQYEMEKKEQEIAYQKALLRRKEWEVRYLSAGGLSILALLFGVLYLYRKKHQAYRLLVQRSLQWSQHLEPAEHRAHNPAANGWQIDPDKEKEIIHQIEALLIGQKMYLEPDLTIEKLSSRLGVHSRYLSRIINEHYDASFPNFINTLRVKEAIRLFTQEPYTEYSIQGIGESVGFKSKSSFIAAFKKVTGVTPGYFRKQLRRL
ncbi:MAG: AraC family transcriptional regulator [Calditrichaeota bacterium]|nr:AraC family transcriptional regulator [Calditrichota bacterium]